MPRWIVALLFLVALSFVLFGGANAAREFDPGVKAERLEQARHLAAINAVREREAWETAERNGRFWSTAVSVGSVAVGLFIAALTLAAMRVAWAGAQIAGAKAVEAQVRARLVYADAMGALPVDAPGLFNGRHDNLIAMTNAGALTVRNTAAANPMPRLPDGLRTYNHAPRLGNQPAPALPNPQAPALPAPSPAAVPALLEMARLAKPDEVVLGVTTDGQPRAVTLDTLGATLIVGERGSGKSTTLAMLAAMCVYRLGASLFVIDRHARLRDSFTQRITPLLSTLAYPVAVSQDEATSVLNLMDHELRVRESGTTGKPFVLLVDETVDIYADPEWEGVATLLGRLSKRLATAGRKMDLGIMCAAQLSDQDSLGGHFAYTVSTFMAHRCAPDLVRRFIGRDAARQLLSLPNGEVIARCMGTVERLRVPQARADELEQIGRVINGRALPVTPPVANRDADDGAGWRGSTTGGGCATGAGVVASPPTGATTEDERRHAQIRKLHADGWSRNKISVEVFGHKDDGTMTEIRAVLGEA